MPKITIEINLTDKYFTTKCKGEMNKKLLNFALKGIVNTLKFQDKPLKVSQFEKREIEHLL